MYEQSQWPTLQLSPCPSIAKAPAYRRFIFQQIIHTLHGNMCIATHSLYTKLNFFSLNYQINLLVQYESTN